MVVTNMPGLKAENGFNLDSALNTGGVKFILRCLISRSLPMIYSSDGTLSLPTRALILSVALHQSHNVWLRLLLGFRVSPVSVLSHDGCEGCAIPLHAKRTGIPNIEKELIPQTAL